MMNDEFNSAFDIRYSKLEKYATFIKERTVYRSERSENAPTHSGWRKEAARDQDLVATLDDLAGYGRFDLRCPQRQTAHPRIRYGKYGRPQVGRVFTDTHVQRTSGNESGEDGEEEVIR